MRKNILLAIHNLRTGGAEVLMKNVSAALSREKFDVSVFVCERLGPGIRELEAKQVPVYSPRRYFSRFDLTILYRAYRVIKRHHIQIVHTNLLVCNIYVRLAAYLARCDKILVHEHGGDLSRPLLVRCLYYFLQFVTDEFVYVSEHDKTHFSRLDKLRGAARLRILPNPCVLEQIPGTMRPEHTGQIQTIGMVGQLNEMKGHRFALAAFAAMKARGFDFEYFLLGDGVLRRHLQNIAENDGLIISMPGIVEDISSYYKKFDLLIHPSLSEGFGMVIVEAMSFGVPVIATRVGGVPEIIHHGYDGWLVNPGSSAEIENAVVRLKDDPSLVRQLSGNARKTAAERYSFRNYISSIESIYLDRV